MKIIFEFSKEFQKLPAAETLACLNSENLEYDILEINNDLLLIKLNKEYKKIISIANKLALSYNVGELLFITLNEIEEIKKNALRHKIKETGSIAIKYRNRSQNIDSQIIIKSLAEILTKNREVNLINPKIEIRCLITDKYVYVYKKIKKIDRSQFEKRKAQFRPFFSPISLHPKLSRGLVNLSMIKKNEILLDPFCGTGGILIEAGILGYHIIGNDIEKNLVNGCNKNLKYYNIKNYKLLNLDIGEINKHISEIDVVVTDFPYGKSTTTKGEPLADLYHRAFFNISDLLKVNGKAIVGLGDFDSLKIGMNYLILKNYFSIKVHNSLTRYFSIFVKSNK
jgi:tRNA (guanine10-N2)-dimethyltransferase